MNAVKPVAQSASDNEQQESAWVAAAQAGDTRAFEQLYRMHAGRVHSLCWRISGGQNALAEELTQEAFIRAWQKLDTFQGDARFGTWLHRVAANVALSDRRSRLRRVDKERPMEDWMLEAAQGTARDNPAVMDLELAISKLPTRARAVLVLHDIEGYLHQDVADMLDMAVGTSKAQLHRARKLLREELEAAR